MAYPDLRSFIDALRDAGELHTIDAPVSPMLEITEIADRVSKSPAASSSSAAAATDPHHHRAGGKALLFTHVQGAAMPLAINVFGSYRRMEMALGSEAGEGGAFADIAARIASLAKPQPPVGIMEKMRKGLELAKVAGMAPKTVRSGPCQQVVHEAHAVDLMSLPIIKCWPHDGNPQAVGWRESPRDAGTTGGDGRYITFGQMYTIHPDDADKPDGQPRPSRNIGMYRAQLIDRNHTVMHWHMHHDGARHWRAWKKSGRRMPLAIAFGGPSVLPYAATAPMPPGISELLLAGLLNGKAIDLVRCLTIDMHVPANAEIVIEGYVDTGPDAADPAGDAPGDALEGPFGDHTGFYSLPDRYPIFTVTAITHRHEPIYPTTIVGLPPQEDYYMGKATERIFLPLLQTLVPDIIDYDLPMFGVFHNCAFIQIRKEYPLQARRVMHAIWGAGQMAWTKMIVVVDDDVNVHDHEQVLLHLCAHCDGGRDIEMVHGPLDILDHAAPQLGAGTKIGFDATRKIEGENVAGHAVRPYPPLIAMTEHIKQQVTRRWHEYGLG